MRFGARVSTGNYADWETQTTAFEKMAVIRFTSLNLTGVGEPEAVPAARVSGDFFAVLGAKPFRGSAFDEQEVDAGAGRLIVLSHGFWKSRFGGDTGVVGRDVLFDGEKYEVVGVMGPEVRLPGFASCRSRAARSGSSSRDTAWRASSSSSRTSSLAPPRSASTSPSSRSRSRSRS